MDVGFVGVGAVGCSIALNLAKGGHGLIVHDRREATLAPLVAAGARAVASPSSVAHGSDIVFTSLPSLDAVESVYLGDGGLLSGARPSQILVDLSTILPGLAQRIDATARRGEVMMLDAPVS